MPKSSITGSWIELLAPRVPAAGTRQNSCQMLSTSICIWIELLVFQQLEHDRNPCPNPDRQRWLLDQALAQTLATSIGSRIEFLVLQLLEHERKSCARKRNQHLHLNRPPPCASNWSTTKITTQILTTSTGSWIELLLNITGNHIQKMPPAVAAESVSSCASDWSMAQILALILTSNIGSWIEPFVFQQLEHLQKSLPKS